MIRSPLITIMTDAALKAARPMKRDFGEIENLQVSRKGPGDFVTAADRRAEQILREALRKARPGYGLVLEEQGVLEGSDKTHRWHVDPLDGTINFMHGVPHFAISIGLEREGQIVAGVIYDPIKDEMFIAERGKGAYLNDRRLRVSGRRDCRTRLWPAASRISAVPSIRASSRRSRPSWGSRAASGASARRRSISPGSPPAGSTFTGSAT